MGTQVYAAGQYVFAIGVQVLLPLFSRTLILKPSFSQALMFSCSFSIFQALCFCKHILFQTLILKAPIFSNPYVVTCAPQVSINHLSKHRIQIRDPTQVSVLCAVCAVAFLCPDQVHHFRSGI